MMNDAYVCARHRPQPRPRPVMNGRPGVQPPVSAVLRVTGVGARATGHVWPRDAPPSRSAQEG